MLRTARLPHSARNKYHKYMPPMMQPAAPAANLKPKRYDVDPLRFSREVPGTPSTLDGKDSDLDLLRASHSSDATSHGVCHAESHSSYLRMYATHLTSHARERISWMRSAKMMTTVTPLPVAHKLTREAVGTSRCASQAVLAERSGQVNPLKSWGSWGSSVMSDLPSVMPTIQKIGWSLVVCW